MSFSTCPAPRLLLSLILRHRRRLFAHSFCRRYSLPVAFAPRGFQFRWLRACSFDTLVTVIKRPGGCHARKTYVCKVIQGWMMSSVAARALFIVFGLNVHFGLGFLVLKVVAQSQTCSPLCVDWSLYTAAFRTPYIEVHVIVVPVLLSLFCLFTNLSRKT